MTSLCVHATRYLDFTDQGSLCNHKIKPTLSIPDDYDRTKIDPIQRPQERPTRPSSPSLGSRTNAHGVHTIPLSNRMRAWSDESNELTERPACSKRSGQCHQQGAGLAHGGACWLDVSSEKTRLMEVPSEDHDSCTPSRSVWEAWYKEGNGPWKTLISGQE